MEAMRRKHKILAYFLEQRGEARRWLSLRLLIEWKECFGHKCFGLKVICIHCISLSPASELLIDKSSLQQAQLVFDFRLQVTLEA